MVLETKIRGIIAFLGGFTLKTPNGNGPVDRLEEDPVAGKSPRKRAGLFLLLVGLAGLLIGVFAVLYFTGSPEEAGPAPALEQGASSPPSPGEAPTDPDVTPSSSPPSGIDLAPRQESPLPEVRLPRKNALAAASMPRITVPPGTQPEELDALQIPPLPYSIYHGIQRTLKESETTQRELSSGYFLSYVVPVEIRESVAQSLYGVSQDGTWYRVLIGHFPTKKSARQFLETLMEARPDDQPEIMKFPYALECGRFLDDQQAAADQLGAALRSDGFFPYTQVYPTHQGGQLIRVLVGCFFSKQGAGAPQRALAERGYSCEVEER